MNFPLSKLRWIVLFVGLALAVIGLEITIAQSTAFGQRSDWIAMGVIVDMAVGIPALYYFLIIRRLTIPVRSLLGIVGLSLTLTAFILPTNHQQLVGSLRWTLVILEVGFLGYTLIRIDQIIRHYRQLTTKTVDFTTNLLKSLDVTLGHSRFNRILVSELSLLRYGLAGWLVPVEKAESDVAFTSHQKSGQAALTVGLVLIGLIETLVVHLLVNRWNPTIAWFATVAGFYGLLFFVADLMATIKRPVLVQANRIVLRFGLRGYGVIDRQNVERIRAINNKPERNANTMNGAFLTVPNVLITVQEPVPMRGPMGIQRSVSRIALFIDDKEKFIHELTA
ncbi:hypothetical protein [Spirosoma endbachense]|uniref:Uncharacterized protein n=1 Tax=Spirosoma endbachense TaxID=2666025 RepID=A0A6P1VT38_9BACT|nr:hypothetical protein [Spirosoma endbachense]QHV95252.1 hypothetical protein GJR95_09610 [Spirosoma endbachense]